MKDLTIPCNNYIVRALEVETQNINRFNLQLGLATVDLSEVAKEVLADWAIKLLLERTGSGPRTDLGS